MDFFVVQTRVKNGKTYIFPSFQVKKSRDLMIRGKAFYAIWDEEAGLWSRDEARLTELVDNALYEFFNEYVKTNPNSEVLSMGVYDSTSWQTYQAYLRSMFDNYKPLDSKVTYLSATPKRNDYVSRRLNYDLEEGIPESYEEIMSTIYSAEERAKLEWAIGSILAGDSVKNQKFVVLYGEAGTGKSTFLHIVEQLFEGYYTTFDAKGLTSRNNSFATFFFKDNPLVAIQHDGDLSKIEDNTIINSIIAHEDIVVNEKFKGQYNTRPICFLFLGTNSPVKISDSKSGLIRRLIDTVPTGNLIDFDRYTMLMDRIPFELGKIANHCLNIYLSMGKRYYNSYKPISMMYATDAFFNFIADKAAFFESTQPVSMQQAYDIYKEYCTETNAMFTLQKYRFRDELKEYFMDFRNGEFYGFKSEKLLMPSTVKKKDDPIGLSLDCATSILDQELADCPAQYANASEIPFDKWENVTRTLKDIDTKKLHYVKPPLNHIVIDFDLKNGKGEKDRMLNLRAADKWPKTYAEFSKGGHGVHLHYIYDGDVEELARLYDKDIEIKIFNGGSSLRRKLTLCNNLPVAHILSGLPLKLKKEQKMINDDRVQDEKHLRALISKALRKEIWPNTTPSIHYIHMILEKAYLSGMDYDVRDMRQAVLIFAMKSTHQQEHCLKLLDKMHFSSERETFEDKAFKGDEPIVFFDVEVFPNLLLVNWMYDESETEECARMINPSPKDIEQLFHFRLIGFNNRRYDNHILYARYLGWSNDEIFKLSQKLIGDKTSNAFFKEAYNLSYTDVYDFASAGNKQSLKKWEIELGLHHQELGLPWDQPVPEELWPKVAEYCDNDVKSTKAVFHHLKGDWTARQMLAKMAGGTVNDTTNQLTTKFIFGNDRNPQLVYTDLKTGQKSDGTKDSIFFPEYEFVNGKNMYRGYDVSRGGYVWSEPGMYENVYTFDVSGMHPASIIALNYFGKYTPRFADMVKARTYIKHKEYDAVREMLNGQLSEYLGDEKDAKAVSNALKTANNSCYGLTSARFNNAMRHPDNDNNIVALRGALMMATLRDNLMEMGVKVIHIKTDSIKVVNPPQETIDYIYNFGKKYGYDFEVEHRFDRICLVNDAVYIAKLANDDPVSPGEWTATGAQFQQPYVFKKLFSHEELTFQDICVTKEVKGDGMYLDMNEALGEDEHQRQFIGRVGLFCPILEGRGGGELVVKRKNEKTGEEKYNAVGGTKGYRWLEAEEVKLMSREDDVDVGYFEALVSDAVDAISKYGNFEAFIGEHGYMASGS